MDVNVPLSLGSHTSPLYDTLRPHANPVLRPIKMEHVHRVLTVIGNITMTNTDESWMKLASNMHALWPAHGWDNDRNRLPIGGVKYTRLPETVNAIISALFVATMRGIMTPLKFNSYSPLDILVFKYFKSTILFLQYS